MHLSAFEDHFGTNACLKSLGAIGLTTAHSGEPLAPKTVAWAVLAGACCGGTQ